ncbi:hypothetical protein BDN70DRAFT_894282 [Pholiota conissans]|uniref:Uncharacterized protein n=1 Tax=Pholiota conissans TaxID=109636 RepID=A0A9P6CUA9_9AGAR|nr:hypothetical protein BDN70DRAFT_894282 [Pholiota conissans]
MTQLRLAPTRLWGRRVPGGFLAARATALGVLAGNACCIGRYPRDDGVHLKSKPEVRISPEALTSSVKFPSHHSPPETMKFINVVFEASHNPKKKFDVEFEDASYLTKAALNPPSPRSADADADKGKSSPKTAHRFHAGTRGCVPDAPMFVVDINGLMEYMELRIPSERANVSVEFVNGFENNCKVSDSESSAGATVANARHSANQIPASHITRRIYCVLDLAQSHGYSPSSNLNAGLACF